MKKHDHIEELLSGYLDDALGPREKTQVRRLLANDPSIAKRLERLARVRDLYQALPVAQAPGDIAERVRDLLERRTLLEENAVGGVPSIRQQRRGAASLFVRKFLAAAAMVALVAVLGGVIYSILAPAPEGGGGTVAHHGGTDPGTHDVPVAPVVPIVAAGFTGRLELTTTNLMTVDGIVNKAIATDTKIESRIERLATTSTYTITCTPGGLDQLLVPLAEAWPHLRSARLVVETDTIGQAVTIDSIQPAQIQQIALQEGSDKTVTVAKNLAMINRMTDDTGIGPLMPPPEALPIPMPRPTGPRDEMDLDSGKVALVIFIATAE